MNFGNISDLKNQGFDGFKTIEEVCADNRCVPSAKGVYMVLTPTQMPQFLKVGTGGFFKGKNPNVHTSELSSNWIANTIVLYIGKAGNVGGSATLRSRLNQYLRFGQGKNVGHWGGRYIWQLTNSSELLLCWRPEIDPREAERQLLADFFSQYKKLPFANLSR